MPSRIARISQNLLTLALSPSEEGLAAMRAEALSSGRFYVVAKEGTKKENWEKRSFAALISEEQELLLFLSIEEAIRFARWRDIVMDGQPMIMKATKQTIARIMMEYYESGLIKSLKIYAIPPMYVNCSVQEFIGVAQKQDEHRERAGNSGEGPGFLDVERVRKVLNTYDNNERRKLDPAGRCENVHQLIETLLMRNSIEPGVLDDTFNFAPGFTRNFCQSIVDSNSSKDTIKKLLSYFGLEAYLYLYKGYSRELQEELKASTMVDLYSLRPARASTKEPFELKQLQRGKDEDNGAYVYGLTLQGKHRKMRIVLSSPFGYSIGKNYEIVGLEPLAEENDIKGVTRAHEVIKEEVPEQPEEQDNIIRPSKPGKQLTGTPEQQKERQDYILGYFKRTGGINYLAAVEKYKVLVEDPDALDAFYAYLKTKKHGWLVRQGFSPQMLMAEYHYPAYEAYCVMIQLANDPDRTKTMLKHRLNEPQYQTKSREKTEK